MQFLSDDTNEWMRKAAEDYPVKPFGMNWEAVASQLADESPENKRAGYVLLRYAAMVVFFMLLSLVCNKYLRLDFENRYAATAVPGETQRKTIASPSVSTPADQQKNKKQLAIEKNELQRVVALNPTVKTSEVSTLKRNDFVEQSTLNYPNTTAFITSVSELEKKVTNTGWLSLIEPPATLLVGKGLKEGDIVLSAIQKEDARKEVVTKRRLYAGLLFGPDISSVKLQKTEGVGYNLGFLLGYRLTDKWQLESGFLLNRKEYYSSGKYFNTGKIYLPAHSYITNVDGYCTMFEIPLNVRYNISQKRNANWFAVAGLSSYLMNKEDYNYTYKRYNVEYKGNKVYEYLSKEWLAVINASIGYEKAITDKIQIRVEPYLKVPLRGMGTGKLPISSAGMNIGISYPIK